MEPQPRCSSPELLRMAAFNNFVEVGGKGGRARLAATAASSRLSPHPLLTGGGSSTGKRPLLGWVNGALANWEQLSRQEGNLRSSIPFCSSLPCPELTKGHKSLHKITKHWQDCFTGEQPDRVTSSLSHSLCYFYLQPSEPNQGLSQFFIRGYLDDQPITRFDSLTRKMEPLVPWMEEVEKERFLAPERVFRAGLEKLSKLDQLAGGLHTWQAILACQLWEGGSKGGFLHYGYDGMDFIGFDKETLGWKTAQTQAQKVKEEWEKDPEWSEKVKSFLEKACIEWLQRYLSY
ncbi:major histocompatibility complex class I-related gene protein-like [Pantherophis guttatus]|uniref:Major histocompatibility complex class I-related gene protein-like n=1 Tax=Pantherophis guttatus TaxID=94885 RepID=A0ABM3ZLW6_PANGU|nr:major histocompatibility complex class I-related gene protein-like [Pantherophis guttatus]